MLSKQNNLEAEWLYSQGDQAGSPRITAQSLERLGDHEGSAKAGKLFYRRLDRDGRLSS